MSFVSRAYLVSANIVFTAGDCKTSDRECR